MLQASITPTVKFLRQITTKAVAPKRMAVERLMSSRIIQRQDFTPAGFKWLGLTRIQWEGPDGRPRVWESVVRTSRKESGVDGVAIIAKVRAEGQPLKLVLEIQFRPPQGSYFIEFPAGLIDGGEDAAGAAVRELREETGYHGTVSTVSPICFTDPGMTNCNLQFVEVDVDADSEANANVDPVLEDGEFIDVFLLPFQGLYKALLDLKAEKGYEVDARLLMYAAGLELGSTLSPPSAAATPALEIVDAPQAEVVRYEDGGNGAGSEEGSAVAAAASSAADPVVVTPEELRKHGIDRVRVVPQGTLKGRTLLNKITLMSAGLGLLIGIGMTQIIAGMGLAIGISWNPRTRLTLKGRNW